MDLWYIYLLFIFTNIENISSHRNKVFISVTSVNFEINKLLLILFIIKKYSENYISFYLISIAAGNISEDSKIIAKLH